MEIIKDYLNEKNYFGLLVYGPHIDEIMEIYGDTILIPLNPLYHNHYIDYLKDFFKSFGYGHNAQNLDTFNQDYSDNIPVCWVLHKCKKEYKDVYALEEDCNIHIKKAKLFLTLISGQPTIEFFKIIRIREKIMYKTELVQYNHLHRLWTNPKEKSSFINDAEKIIDNQNFSLTLFHDANREANHIYKSARYFMVLESITESNHQSRKHIKIFFSKSDYNPSLNYNNSVTNHNLANIDAIEIAGIIRAKLFHGAALKYKYFKNIISMDDFNYIVEHPEDLSRHMRDLCEVAFYIKNKQGEKVSY